MERLLATNTQTISLDAAHFIEVMDKSNRCGDLDTTSSRLFHQRSQTFSISALDVHMTSYIILSNNVRFGDLFDDQHHYAGHE